MLESKANSLGEWPRKLEEMKTGEIVMRSGKGVMNIFKYLPKRLVKQR